MHPASCILVYMHQPCCEPIYICALLQKDNMHPLWTRALLLHSALLQKFGFALQMFSTILQQPLSKVCHSGFAKAQLCKTFKMQNLIIAVLNYCIILHCCIVHNPLHYALCVLCMVCTQAHQSLHFALLLCTMHLQSLINAIHAH